MATVSALIRATHAVPAASVTALVALLAVLRHADASTLGWMVASTAAGQASVGWSNEYLDRHDDAAANRAAKPLVAGTLTPATVWRAAIAAGVTSVALSLPLGVPETGVMAVAVASAWTYNLGAKRTAGSWAPYAVSFGLLPVYAWMATGPSLPPSWVVAAAALLGVAGHLTNVVPDLEADARVGTRGLPHRLGRDASLGLAALLLAAVLVLAVVVGGALRRPSPASAAAAGVAAVAVGVLVVGPVRARARAAFHLTIVAAGAVALLIGLSPGVAR